MRMNAVRIAVLIVTLAAGRGKAFDVILDPKQVSAMLAEIAKFHDETKSGKTKDEQAEALFEMGERVLDLTELMTQDYAGHGSSDPSLVALIERRLKENGVSIIKTGSGFGYDLAAFREYLRLAPTGSRAAEARYVLVGFDEPGDDVAALQKSMLAKENFIRNYPKFQDISVVELLLAQQHAHLERVYSKQRKEALSAQEHKAALERYRRIIRLYPNTDEAETARDALKF